MANNYYIICEGQYIEGPFSFREATKVQIQNKQFHIKSVIAKVVINEDGKEVK